MAVEEKRLFTLMGEDGVRSVEVEMERSNEFFLDGIPLNNEDRLKLMRFLNMGEFRELSYEEAR